MFELETGAYIVGITSLVILYLAVLGDTFYIFGLIDCEVHPHEICKFSKLRKLFAEWIIYLILLI